MTRLTTLVGQAIGVLALLAVGAAIALVGAILLGYLAGVAVDVWSGVGA